MKITSLVAVLALCCAALAGSAYAYTATYVDTIGEQPIEDVYLEVSSEKSGYGGYDLDLEYNTYKKGAGATYFALERATIANDVTAEFVETNGNTARYVLLIDTLTITAKGDTAYVSKVTAEYGTANALSVDGKGITAFIVLSDAALDAMPAAAAYADLTFDAPKKIAVAEKAEEGEPTALTVYAYLVIDVDQLAAHAEGEPVGYSSAKAGITIGDAILAGFDVKFVATAAQTTA